MRKLLIAALLVFLGAVCVLAQDEKNEIAGTIGRTFISDQTPPNTSPPNNVVHFGHGTSFEINYARRLRTYSWWGSLWVEVPAIFNPDEDLNYGTNQIPKEYSSYFITPAARFNLIPNLAISPWVSFGGGIGHFTASKDLVFFGTNTGSRGKTTGVLQAGVGMDVRLPGLQRLRFRFEARDDWSGAPPLNINTGKDHQHNYYVAGGAAFRF
jgi:hypothetical protein